MHWREKEQSAELLVPQSPPKNTMADVDGAILQVSQCKKTCESLLDVTRALYERGFETMIEVHLKWIQRSCVAKYNRQILKNQMAPSKP